MNDIQQNLILQGDSSGAVQALNKTNKATKNLVQTIQSVDKDSSSFMQKKVAEFKRLEQEAKQIEGLWDEIFDAEGLDFTKSGGKDNKKRVEDIKELGGAIGDLESGFLALEGGGIGALASVENFANVLLNMPTSLLPVTLAVGAGLTALAVGFNEAKNSMYDLTGGLRDVMKLSDEYYRILVEGTGKDVETSIEELETQRQIKELRRQAIQEELELFQGIPIEVARVARAVGFNEDVMNAFEEWENLGAEIEDTDKQIKAFNEALSDTELIARGVENALKELSEREEELQEQRTSQAKKVSELRLQSLLLEDAFEDRLATEQKLLELQEKRRQEDETLTANYEAQKKALEDLFEAQDTQVKEAEEQAKLQEKLTSLQVKSNEVIRQLESDMLSKRNETQQKLSELEKDFQKQAIDRQKEYQQKRQDIEDSFNMTRLQAFASQDAKSLFFATMAKDASLQDVDAEQAEAEAEAKEAYKERVKEIHAELKEFKKAQDEKIKAERQALEESLQAEKEAYEARQIMEEQDALKKEQRALAFQALEEQLASERERLTKERAEEDRQTRIDADRAVLQEQLRNIDIKKKAETEAYNEIIAQLNAVYFERDLTNGLGYESQRQAFPTMQFATGALFTSPTRLNNALIAEAEPEAIIPISQLGGGGQVSLSIPVSVQGDASEKTIKLIQDAVKAEGMTIVKAVSDTLRLTGRPK